DQSAPIGDHHHLVARLDLGDADDPAGALAHLHRDDALPTAGLQPVLVELAALPLAALGDGEDRRPRTENDEAHHLVLALEGDTANAAGGSSHRAHVALAEADRLPVAGREKHLVPGVHDARADEPVPPLEIDRDQAGRAPVRVRHQVGLLHRAATRAEDDPAAID